MARKEMMDKQVTIYLPSKTDVERWQSLSKAKNSSLSRWIFEMVELALEEARPIPKPKIIDEALRKENIELRREIEQISKLRPWPKFTSFREIVFADANDIFKEESFEEAIKVVLQKGGIWSGEKLTKELKPYLDSGENLRTLNKVLQSLIDNGSVEELERGFKWIK